MPISSYLMPISCLSNTMRCLTDGQAELPYAALSEAYGEALAGRLVLWLQ